MTTPSAIDAFKLRCEARALLVKDGAEFLDVAVDALQNAAEASGLVAELGPDRVQEIMATAFKDQGINEVDDAPIQSTNGLDKDQQDIIERWDRKEAEAERKRAEAKAKNKRSELPHTTQGKSLLWPYQARPFAEIPRRRWLHAGHYIREQVVMTVAPGGYGKTSLEICNSLEMVTGRGLIGPAPPVGPLNVGYWNAEDPDEEIERRIAAACIRHKIDPAALQGKLFLGSRLSGKQRVASLDHSGNVVFDTAMLAEIERLITELHLDCVIFDPLIAFHRVPEGDVP